jgi:uncharacterized damage-inducible protein DinB
VFSLDLFDDLYAHMEWADARVWDAVTASLGTGMDDCLRDRLLHLHVVQQAFLHVWTSQPVVFPAATEFPSFTALEPWVRAYYPEVRAFLATLDDSRLAEPLHMPWVAQFEKRLGRGFDAPTLGDTLFQVTSHSTYHRGQVNTRLRELGGEPPLVDYIAWVWFGRPAAAWSRSGEPEVELQ